MANSYRIIDRQTQRQVGTDYSSRTRAQTRADRLDNAYGAVRYSVRPVYTVAEALVALNERIAKGIEYPTAHCAVWTCYGLNDAEAGELTRLYEAQS